MIIFGARKITQSTINRGKISRKITHSTINKVKISSESVHQWIHSEQEKALACVVNGGISQKRYGAHEHGAHDGWFFKRCSWGRS